MYYELVHVITNEKLKGKNGKEFRKTYYAIRLDNGNIVLFKPVFDEDYAKLDLICKKEFRKDNE